MNNDTESNQTPPVRQRRTRTTSNNSNDDITATTTRMRRTTRRTSAASAVALPSPPPAPPTAAAGAAMADIQWFEKKEEEEDEDTIRAPDKIRTDRLISSVSPTPSLATSRSSSARLGLGAMFNDEENERMMMEAIEASRRCFHEEEAKRVKRQQRCREAWARSELQGLEKRLSWFIRYPPFTDVHTSVWTTMLELYRHFETLFSRRENDPSPFPEMENRQQDVESTRIVLFRVVTTSPESIHPQMKKFLDFLDEFIAIVSSV